MTGFYNLVFYGIYEYTTAVQSFIGFDECLFFKLAIKNLIDIIFFSQFQVSFGTRKKKLYKSIIISNFSKMISFS